ncbi:hypothetical protein [Robbsia andropogonis]|nr:hypothetical protein [Robbsia andropogonis]
MVDRYDDIIARIHGPSGKSVSYDDYAAMKAERDALIEIVARQEQAVKDLQRIGDERAREFMLERDALAAQVDALKGWEFMDTGGGAWTIVSPFGDHVLVHDHAGEPIASQMLAMLAKAIAAAREQKQ